MWPRYLDRLKRGPQVILPKDAAMIISYSEICKESVVIEAGSGSGWLSAQIGRIAKKVYSFEKREDFSKLAKKNCEKLGLDNVEFAVCDVITEGFSKKGVADVLILDLADSHQAVPKAIEALKEDGVLVGYVPHTDQLSAFIRACEENGFADTYACESIVREMLVRNAGVRPENTGILHTAYLVFACKGEKKLSRLEQKRARKKR